MKNARLALGLLVLLLVGVALWRTLGFGIPAAVVVVALTSALLLARLPRWARVAVLAASGGGAWVLLAGFHEELRGERPDPDPDPTVAYATEGPKVESAPGEPVRLLVWGDCRSGLTVLGKLCDAIRERQPTLSVGLGDLVGMARAYQFQLLSERLERTRVPYRVVPGNHDVDPFGTLRPYGRVFGARNWAFPVREARALLVGLDTARGLIDPADAAWVERQVTERDASTPHVLLFCHHPLWQPAAAEDHEKALPEDDATKRVRSLVEREAIHVFASHFHGYDVLTRGAVTQVTTGGAGARPESPGPYHYVWVTFDATGVHAEKVDLARQDEVSETVDRFLAFRDDAAYTAREWPTRFSLALLGVGLFLGGLLSAFAPRKRVPGAPPAAPSADDGHRTRIP